MEEMMKHKSNRNFFADNSGFSTTLDIFLFLAMVSISAVILLPTITGNTQIAIMVSYLSGSAWKDLVTYTVYKRVN